MQTQTETGMRERPGRGAPASCVTGEAEQRVELAEPIGDGETHRRPLLRKEGWSCRWKY
jgi:hypothetical protein